MKLHAVSGFLCLLVLTSCTTSTTREETWHAVGRYLCPDGTQTLVVKHFTYPGPSADYYKIRLETSTGVEELATITGTYSWRLQPVTIVWLSDTYAQVFVVVGTRSTIKKSKLTAHGITLEIIEAQDVLLLPELKTAYRKFGQAKKDW